MKTLNLDSLPLEKVLEIDFALAVMSLDLAVGTLAPMGLHVPHEGDFRAAIREELGRRPLGPAIGEAGVARVVGLLQRFETLFGLPFVESLVEWICNIFLGAPEDQVFLWHRVIVNGGLDGDQDDSPPPAVVQRIRKELATLLSEVPLKVPQSDWDKRLLTAYGFPTLPTPGGMESSPMNIIENRMDDVAFLAAWSRVLEQTSLFERDIEDLWTWGKREGEEMGFQNLKRPGSWRR